MPGSFKRNMRQGCTRAAGRPASLRNLAASFSSGRCAPRRVQRRGFTLLELVMVLMLIAIVLAAAAPSLRGWNRGQRLDNAAQQLLSATRWARSQAIATASPHRIEFTGSGWNVTRLDAGSYVPATGEFALETLLPEGFYLDCVRQDESGAAVIDFHPNGRLTPATLTITAEWGESAVIASTAAAESFRLTEPGGS